jgi:hypothetical protein
MIESRPKIEAKTLSKAKAGELICVAADGEVWTTLVLASDQHSTLLAFLHSTGKNNKHPFYAVLKDDRKCLSYGENWILEPTITGETFGNPSQISLTGALFLDGPSYVAVFSPVDMDYSKRRSFNLTERRLQDDVSRQALFFPEWKIWVSEEERIRGCSPKITVSSAQMI